MNALGSRADLWPSRRSRAVPPIIALVSALIAGCGAPLAAGVLPADLERFDLIPEADARCDGFRASETHGFNSEQYAAPGLAEQFEAADVVAHVVVEAVLPARYWTPTGAPPTDPEADRFIHRPMALRVVERFKGPADVAGVVDSRMGGCDRRASFAFESSPELLTGDLGDEGIMFGSFVDESWGDQRPGWFIHLDHAASVRSREGARFVPVLTENWYLREDGLAVSAIDWSSEPRPFDEVLDLLRGR